MRLFDAAERTRSRAAVVCPFLGSWSLALPARVAGGRAEIVVNIKVMPFGSALRFAPKIRFAPHTPNRFGRPHGVIRPSAGRAGS